MSLGGDPEDLRVLARRADQMAELVREEGTTLLHTTAATSWKGVAADRYRERARDLKTALEESAGATDSVATDLHHLAATLEERQRMIRNAVGILERYAYARIGDLLEFEQRQIRWAQGVLDTVGDIATTPVDVRIRIDVEVSL